MNEGPGPAADTLACAACGATPPEREPWPFECPHAASGDGADHLLARRLDPARATFACGDSPNPFVRHRGLLHAYARARGLGWTDARFVELVERLDAKVAAVDGRGFRTMPFVRAEAPSLDGVALWCKDETGSVGGSHKARHLFGLALHLAIAEESGLVRREETDRRGLAIASCGNAALAAAVVARATERPLSVFIPTDADPHVVERLRGLGARIDVCRRRAGVTGDPCLHGFRRARASGALPFCVQGSENGLAVEGGMTLGWELAAQMAKAGVTPDRLFVQVGGGALASATVQALQDAEVLGAVGTRPRLHAVQTNGAAPLRRAYEHVRALALASLGEGPPPAGERAASDAALATKLALPGSRAAVRAAMEHARAHRAECMWAWEETPQSIAHGILDDETYDWAAIVEGMLETGGWPVTVDDALLRRATDMARQSSPNRVDPTGASGLAGLLALAASDLELSGETAVVLLTGAERE